MITTVRDTAEWLAIFDNTLQAHSDVDRFKKALDREHPAAYGCGCRVDLPAPLRGARREHRAVQSRGASVVIHPVAAPWRGGWP